MRAKVYEFASDRACRLPQDLAQSMGYLHDLGNPIVRQVTDQAIRQIVAAGRTCGTSPLSEADLKAHHAAGARFFYTQVRMLTMFCSHLWAVPSEMHGLTLTGAAVATTQPLNLVTQASRDFFQLVDSSSRGVQPKL